MPTGPTRLRELRDGAASRAMGEEPEVSANPNLELPQTDWQSVLDLEEERQAYQDQVEGDTLVSLGPVGVTRGLPKAFSEEGRQREEFRARFHPESRRLAGAMGVEVPASRARWSLSPTGGEEAMWQDAVNRARAEQTQSLRPPPGVQAEREEGE